MRKQEGVAELTAALAAVEQQLAALNTATDFDPDTDFALKTEIGGIRSESRRTKRRRSERWDSQSRQYVALMERKRVLEARLAHAQVAPDKAAAVAQVETILRAMLQVGDQVAVVGSPNAAVVTRLNTRSVSVQFSSNSTERVEWAAVRPVEWQRMYADWKAANPIEFDGDEASHE